MENAGLVDCAEKDHTDFDLSNTDEAQTVYLNVLASALKGIIARGGKPGLTSEKDIEILKKRAEDDMRSGRTIFGFQMKWVWGRK